MLAFICHLRKRISVTVKTVHACLNFQVSCQTFECRMPRFGNNLQRFSPNVPTFRQNVRANLSNFIQDLFWHVTFSNEDFKMVEDGAASLAIVKICSWINMLLRLLDVRRKASRYISASHLNELKKR